MEPVAFDDIPLEIFLQDIMDLTRLFPEDFPAEFAKMAARIGVEKQHLFITDFIEDTREHAVGHYLGYVFDALNRRMYQYEIRGGNKLYLKEIPVEDLTVRDTDSVKVLHLL